MSKLKFDLDDTAIKKNAVIPSVNNDAPTLDEINNKKNFETTMLPVLSLNKDGEQVIVMKPLQSVSADEFKLWLKQVLPFPDEYMDNYMSVSINRKENNFNNIRIKEHVFMRTVMLHEIRWLFGLGPLPKSEYKS
jgi:hypothetical protein